MISVTHVIFFAFLTTKTFDAAETEKKGNTTTEASTFNATGTEHGKNDAGNSSSVQKSKRQFTVIPWDYMPRRRPSSVDNDIHITLGRAPAAFKCRKSIPPPTNISLSIHIAEISSVKLGKVTMSIYLYYSWQDFRFAHILGNFTSDYLEVAANIKDELWLPDLFVPNAANVINPDIFVPTTSFRIYKNLTVLANQYLLLELACPFDYSFFPMDDQTCNIALMSYGYTQCGITIRWSSFDPLTYTKSTLTQFSYHVVKVKDSSKRHEKDFTRFLERSQVHIHLVLRRKALFYLMQIYIPSALFVVVSWISFLIPAEMAQGRMLLTITTMLTMVSLFAAGSEYVPKASYIKAIDVWMFTCTFLAFYAVVDCLIDIRLSIRKAEQREEMMHTFVLTEQARKQTVMDIIRKHVRGHTRQIESGSSQDSSDESDDEEELGGGVVMQCKRLYQRMRETKKTAVFVYPAIFILFNITYWSVCIGAIEMHVHKELGEH